MRFITETTATFTRTFTAAFHAAMTVCLAVLVAGPLCGPGAAAAAPAEEPQAVLEPADGVTQRPRRSDVVAWHHRWRPAVRPVIEAVGDLHAAVLAGRTDATTDACSRLGHALGKFQDSGLVRAPDYAVAYHLRSTLRHLDRAARACRTGRASTTPVYLAAAGRTYHYLALALVPYGLEP